MRRCARISSMIFREVVSWGSSCSGLDGVAAVFKSLQWAFKEARASVCSSVCVRAWALLLFMLARERTYVRGVARRPKKI